jgi:hypothetical protein
MKFGLMDDGYWKLIRHNALKYWIEWDRNKIFNVEEINKNEEAMRHKPDHDEETWSF